MNTLSHYATARYHQAWHSCQICGGPTIHTKACVPCMDWASATIWKLTGRLEAKTRTIIHQIRTEAIR
jgi:hypothetical protein